MGVEVKGAGEGVVIADRGCSDRCSERPEHRQSSGSCLEDRYYNASLVI